MCSFALNAGLFLAAPEKNRGRIFILSKDITDMKFQINPSRGFPEEICS
jgi:hypothetical protein